MALPAATVVPGYEFCIKCKNLEKFMHYLWKGGFDPIQMDYRETSSGSKYKGLLVVIVPLPSLKWVNLKRIQLVRFAGYSLGLEYSCQLKKHCSDGCHDPNGFPFIKQNMWSAGNKASFYYSTDATKLASLLNIVTTSTCC
jgi:hypothetical protein